MTKIYFANGRPILRDGKVGTAGDCCVCPACCQHFCNKMCCNQIKWTVPGYTDSYTTVGQADCRTTLTLPESGVQIRLRVRCSGYVYEGSGYQDCDTDCEIVEVEYSEDGGTTWTTTPPSAADGVTWSIYCSGDAAQPESETSAQRCAALTATNQQTCENELDGEFCNLFTQAQDPCPPCGLACGFEPTEWRLVGYGGLVWFAGDVIPNPLYTGEYFCSDPCDPYWPSDPASPRFLLEHFPFVNSCAYTPAGWPRTEGDWLYLEVLGCGGGWQRVKQWCGCFPNSADGFFWNVIDATDPCSLSAWFWSYNGYTLRGNDGAGIILQSPPGCACLRDPATGNMVGHTDNTYGVFCCPRCNRYLGATGCSTGLEYLEHGVAVRFTGAVDNEGSNLWNWQDSKSESPAGFWPSGAITIAGELRSWRGPTASGAGGNYHPNLASLSFPSVTLEPGAVLAISLTTETLTVDDATIEELTLVSGVPKACANGGEYAVGITVTGTATFKNGAETYVTGAFSNPSAPHAGITGNCVFESGSKNFGTIAGNCDFSDDASNEGTITGNCTFTDTAVNNGTITGDATFSGNAVNAGTVTGNCTFIGSATNTGTVDGDATFSGTASMAGNVTGTATFTDSACHTSGTAGTFDPDPPPAC